MIFEKGTKVKVKYANEDTGLEEVYSGIVLEYKEYPDKTIVYSIKPHSGLYFRVLAQDGQLSLNE